MDHHSIECNNTCTTLYSACTQAVAGASLIEYCRGAVPAARDAIAAIARAILRFPARRRPPPPARAPPALRLIIMRREN
ncbi:hypothetical protein EVAR_29535_1 [Eumeta japonica]|uniref:Uncharacterized protein n=1 Tax=Eumeta variegata TaxID=151549 RepID=A0A4C1WHB6_EUMVA|nr:hypothetical protein EVAR_29535_1 [Eumeta japonica]